MNIVCQYFYNWLVLGSQAMSVLLGGHPDESISQRTARAYLAKSGAGWFYYQKAIIDAILFVLTGERDHCIKSLDGEANAKTIWNWDK